MGVSSSESHDLTAFYEMLSVSFGVLSQNTGFYPSLDRIIETTLRPLNLGPGGGSYNEPISRLHRYPAYTRVQQGRGVGSACKVTGAPLLKNIVMQFSGPTPTGRLSSRNIKGTLLQSSLPVLTTAESLNMMLPPINTSSRTATSPLPIPTTSSTSPTVISMLRVPHTKLTDPLKAV